MTLCLHLDSRQADTRQNQSSKLIFGSHTHPNTAFFNVSRTRPRWFNNVAGVGSETSSQQLSALAEEFFSWRIETWSNYGTRFGINDYNNLAVEYTEGEFIRQRVGKAVYGWRVRFSRGQLRQAHLCARTVFRAIFQSVWYIFRNCLIELCVQ